MRYSAIIIGFAASAAAAPFSAVCPAGLYSSAQCCATDVLGVAGLNCAVRTLINNHFTHKVLLT
jgi:hypothetical protein